MIGYFLDDKNFEDAIVATSIACTLFFIRDKYRRRVIEAMENYQAHDHWQTVRISNAVTRINQVVEECRHTAGCQSDPEHQNCCSAVRQEARVIASAIGRSPNPDMILGKRKRASSPKT